MLHASRLVIGVLVALPLLAACGTSGPDAADGDCNARIRYEDVIYRPHNALSTTAPTGTDLGVAEVVGCGDGASAPAVDELKVSSVEGVSPSIAVTSRHGEWKGTYVAEGVPRSDWPAPLLHP